MDSAPRVYWQSTIFIEINYVTSYLWAGIFFISTASNMVPIIFGETDNGTFRLIFDTIVPLVGIFLGFRLTTMYVSYAKQQAQKTKQLLATPSQSGSLTRALISSPQSVSDSLEHPYVMMKEGDGFGGESGESGESGEV